MKLRKALAGILGAVVMLLGVGTFEHVNRDTGVHAANGNYELADSIAVNDKVLLVYETGKKELSGISTTSTKYGIGVDYSGAPIGAYPLDVVPGKTSGTYAFKNGSNYLTWTSGNSLNKATSLSENTSWTVTFSGKNAVIKNVADTSRQIKWNTGSPRFACYTSGQSSIQLYKFVLNDCVHANTSKETTPATCTEKGSVVETCNDCGAVVSASDIEATGHNFVNGVCTGCKLDAISGVKALFNEYYNNNQYLKETVLNTTGIADEEVKTYFHASASVKERETWYFGDKTNGTTKLVMNTHEDLEDDDVIGEVDVNSTYENKENKVYHTGKGGNWFVNWSSVEDKFVTLKDFIDSTDTDKNWICDDKKKVFTYNLTPATADNEHEMTRLAREFVAPMWLAPNADNYSYARFTKLTVEEKTDVGLIMTLYVHEGDFSKTSGNDGVFAVATINNVYNVEINIEGNGTVVEENRLIAGNHAIEYTVNIPEGYRISSATAIEATIGTTTEGFALNKATGDVKVNLVVEEKSNDPITETLSFASTASRQSLTTSKQVWVNGGITFTNNKSTSTNNVADYSNPIRLYKNSEIIIEANQMTKLVLNSSSSSGDYYNALKSSLDAASIKYTNNGTKFTIEFAAPVDSFVLKLSGGQVRFTSIDVTYIAE